MAQFKATPKAILKGIRDLSKRALVPAPEQIPTNLPQVFLLAERGPAWPQVVIGDAFTSLYGDKTLDLQSKYANHQTVLATTMMKNGNSLLVQRIVPPGAKKALLRLSVEVIRTQVTKYQRDPDTGHYLYDAEGNPKPEMTGPTGSQVPATVEGYRVIPHIGVEHYSVGGGPGNLPNQQLFGNAKAHELRLGDTSTGGANPVTLSTYTDDVMSTIYPIIDQEVSFAGEYGNLVGMALSAPSTDTNPPANAALIEAKKAFMYRFAMLEKPKVNAMGNVLPTLLGDSDVDLTFRETTLDNSGNYISVQEALLQAYTDIDTPGYAPVYGPFGRAHVYTDDIETLSDLLIDGEVGVNPIPSAPGEKSSDVYFCNDAGDPERSAWRTQEGRFSDEDGDVLPGVTYLINFLTGVDQRGVPYETFTTEKAPLFGGVVIGAQSQLYAGGGDDGLSTDASPTVARLADLKTYDAAVNNVLTNWGLMVANPGETPIPMLDDAQFPLNSVWDSGFSMETKLKLLKPMARRKDVMAILSPQEVAHSNPEDDADDPVWVYATQNDETAENGNAMSLKEAALNYPESEAYGTPACRAMIIGHSGYQINSLWKGLLPLTIDFANKVSRYMGAGNGIWDNAYAFDQPGLNQVEGFRGVNLTWKNDKTYDNNWDNGLVFVRHYDRSSLFYPAFQTVYPDDTSVLNNFFTMAVGVEVEKVCQRTWRDLTGRTLSIARFEELSDQLIEEKTRGRFDDRVIIIPRTSHTAADKQRGFSWTCEAELYAPNMSTVGSFTINARRIDELDSAA